MGLFNTGKIGRKILISSGITGSVFIIFVCYSFWEIDQLFITNAQLQVGVDEVQTQLHELYESLLMEESAIRDYYLTEDNQFLDVAIQSRNEFSNIVDQLLLKLENQPVFADEILAIINEGKSWQEQYGKKLMEMARNHQQPFLETYQQSKVAFDDFQSSLQQTITLTNQFRDDYRAKYREKISMTMMVLFVVSFVLIILNIFIMKRQTDLIVKPIINLNKSVKAYASKEFSIGIPSYPREDELKELIQNINSMRLQLQEKFKRMESLADRDGITGIFNRRYFDECLRKEWMRASYYQQPITLILLDIDYFKKYNDTYGHLEGDRCLKQIATKIQEIFVHSSEIVARYGGEEFAVILPGKTNEFALKKAEKLRTSIMDLEITHPSSLVHSCVTISIGIASVIPNKNICLPTDLIELADQALYESKANGRNRITQYVRKQADACNGWKML